MRSIAGAVLLTVVIVSAASAAVDTFVVSDQGLTNVELSYLEPGRLFFKAEGLDVRNRPELVFGVSEDLGENWRLWRMPLLTERPAWPMHCLAHAGLYWGYGGVSLGPANRKDMPVYYSDDEATWGGSTVTATASDVDKRVVNDVQMGHRQGCMMWAGGYESTKDGLKGRLWRSTDSGVYWEPVSLPGVTSRDLHVGGRAPDYTVYGWTHEDLLRLSPDGTVKVLPGFEFMWDVYGLCAPTNNRLVACWRGGWTEVKNYYLSYSDDRGATWDHRSTGLSGTPVIDARDDLLLAGMQSANPLVFDGSYLHLIIGQDGQIVWTEALSGSRILGVVLAPPGHAVALVMKSDPRYLYCVRRMAETSPAANHPPTAPDVKLRPRHPRESDAITCTASGSTDPDGDRVTYRYQWYKDDMLQPGLTNRTLAAKWTAAGERWKCVVTPTDGKDDGPSGESQVKVER